MANSITENIDCMEAMAKVPDGWFGIACVDPPYNIVSQQDRGIGSRIDATGKMNGWNNKKPSQEYFDELFRVSQYQIIWGANNFTLPETEYFLIWYKRQTVDNFADAEYAWTNIKQPAQVFDYSIHKTMADRKSDGGKIHPTQKPVALYDWIFKKYAKPGMKILDTHLGSGSSRIAAHKAGLDFWGYELDKDYFDAQEKRFEQYMAQLKLFG